MFLRGFQFIRHLKNLFVIHGYISPSWYNPKKYVVSVCGFYTGESFERLPSGAVIIHQHLGQVLFVTQRLEHFSVDAVPYNQVNVQAVILLARTVNPALGLIEITHAVITGVENHRARRRQRQAHARSLYLADKDHAVRIILEPGYLIGTSSIRKYLHAFVAASTSFFAPFPAGVITYLNSIILSFLRPRLCVLFIIASICRGIYRFHLVQKKIILPSGYQEML